MTHGSIDGFQAMQFCFEQFRAPNGKRNCSHYVSQKKKAARHAKPRSQQPYRYVTSPLQQVDLLHRPSPTPWRRCSY